MVKIYNIQKPEPPPFSPLITILFPIFKGSVTKAVILPSPVDSQRTGRNRSGLEAKLPSSHSPPTTDTLLFEKEKCEVRRILQVPVDLNPPSIVPKRQACLRLYSWL